MFYNTEDLYVLVSSLTPKIWYEKIFLDYDDAVHEAQTILESEEEKIKENKYFIRQKWYVCSLEEAKSVLSEKIESESYDNGYENGSTDGYSEGYDNGKHEGYDNGYENGSTDGYSEGYDNGKHEGYDNGYRDGQEEAKCQSLTE